MKITASPFYHALSGRKITPGSSLLRTSWFKNRNTGPCGVYLWGFYTGDWENKEFDPNKFMLTDDKNEIDFTVYYVGKVDHHTPVCGCNLTPPTVKLLNIGERLLQEWSQLFGGFYPTLKFDHFVNFPDSSNVWLYQQADIGQGPLLHKSKGLEAYKDYLNDYPSTPDFLKAQNAMKERLIFCWIEFSQENGEDDNDKKEKIRDVEKKLIRICGENSLGIGGYELGDSGKAEKIYKSISVDFSDNPSLDKYLEAVAKKTKESHDKYFDRKGIPPYPSGSTRPRYENEVNFINNKISGKPNPNGKSFYHY